MDLWDKSADDAAAFEVVAAVARAIPAMRLKEYVLAASKAIDLIDIELIEDFWRSSGA
jgi:hypothetical protein